MQFTINPVATMQSYQQRNIDDYVKPRAPNRPGNQMSPGDAIADQKKRDYLDSLKMKMETRVGRQLEDEFNTKTPLDGVSTNASSPEPRRNPRNPYGNHADRLRNQRENIGRNIPG